MPCGGCAARRRALKKSPNKAADIMGGYKYLNDRQIRARLEVYKKNNCQKCPKRYKCDYGTFVECKKIK